MKAVQISAPGGPFELVERELPSPGPGWVRLKVYACGVCHSDRFVKEGHWPGLKYPRITGHEVAGVIDALGETSRIGRPASAPAWAGTAATAAFARLAGGAISRSAASAASPDSRTTAVTPST